jgi:hypothetical protein
MQRKEVALQTSGSTGSVSSLGSAVLPSASSSPAAQPPQQSSRVEVPLDIFYPEFEQIRATGILPTGQPAPRPGGYPAYLYGGSQKVGVGRLQLGPLTALHLTSHALLVNLIHHWR